MFQLIEWPTVQAVINNIVLFTYFFEFKLILLCDM